MNEDQAKLAASRLTLLASLQSPAKSEDASVSKGKAKGKASVTSAPVVPTKGKGRGKAGPPDKGKGKGPPPPPGKGKGKGKVKGGIEPTRLDVKTGVPMHSLDWKRFIFGKEPLIEGKDTIWQCISDEIANDFVLGDAKLRAEIEERFGKDTSKKVATMTSAKKTEKFLTASIDPKVRLQLELFVKKFKSKSLEPDTIAKAICAKDGGVLDRQLLKDLARMCDQIPINLEDQLKLKEKATPGVPFGEVEQYMLQLKKIPALEARLECWGFLEDLPDMLEMYSKMSHQLHGALDCFRNSKALPVLLSVTLAVGNFLNGGNKRLGRADAFHMDAFGKNGDLTKVKDATRKGLGELILKYFIANHPAEAALLLSELAPMFQLIRRRVTLGEAWDVDKEVSSTVESFKKNVTMFVRAFREKKAKLDEVGKDVMDQADTIHTDFAVTFKGAEGQIQELAGRLVSGGDSFRDADDAKEQLGEIGLLEYKLENLMIWFCDEKTELYLPLGLNHQHTTFELFCLTWDDFLFPESAIIGGGRAEKVIKDQIIPRFCKVGKEIALGDLEFLWGFKQAGSSPKSGERKRREGLTLRKRTRRTKHEDDIEEDGADAHTSNPAAAALLAAMDGAATASDADLALASVPEEGDGEEPKLE